MSIRTSKSNISICKTKDFVEETSQYVSMKSNARSVSRMAKLCLQRGFLCCSTSSSVLAEDTDTVTGW